MSAGFHPALLPPGVVGGPTGPAGVTGTTPARATNLPTSGPSFADVLAKQTATADAPRFSRHALQRLQQRGIEVSGTELARLSDGISRAAGKGSRDSVIFVDRTAFVVSVPNNTVITAVNSEHMREHVFTNIDSAVFA